MKKLPNPKRWQAMPPQTQRIIKTSCQVGKSTALLQGSAIHDEIQYTLGNPPCRNCYERQEHHIDGKCPFEPSTWLKPTDEETWRFIVNKDFNREVPFPEFEAKTWSGADSGALFI